MQNEETKNHQLRQRLAELEHIVGQKQMEIDFLNKLMEVGSTELGFDLKKVLASHHRMVPAQPAKPPLTNDGYFPLLRHQPVQSEVY